MPTDIVKSSDANGCRICCTCECSYFGDVDGALHTHWMLSCS